MFLAWGHLISTTGVHTSKVFLLLNPVATQSRELFTWIYASFTPLVYAVLSERLPEAGVRGALADLLLLDWRKSS